MSGSTQMSCAQPSPKNLRCKVHLTNPEPTYNNQETNMKDNMHFCTMFPGWIFLETRRELKGYIHAFIHIVYCPNRHD